MLVSFLMAGSQKQPHWSTDLRILFKKTHVKGKKQTLFYKIP